MGSLNTPTEALLAGFAKAEETDLVKAERGEGYRMSRAVSAAAFWYEKLRTAMEYREGYLLRRSAIQRILTRKLIVVGEAGELLESLIRELIWARYLPTASLSSETKDEALGVIDLYLAAVKEIENVTVRSWVISIMASELEKTLAKSFWMRQEALINYAFFFLSRQLEVVGDVGMPLVNVQLYIAVWRVFLRADDEILTFLLLKQRVNDIYKRVEILRKNSAELKGEIEGELGSVIAERLQRFVEANLPPFLVLRDLFEEYPKEARSVLSDEVQLSEAVGKVCEKRYASIHQRVRTAITRSVVYIFLTKMVIALLLEVPIDRWLYGETLYLSLVINSLFPPGLMFGLSFSIQTPDRSNTDRIQRLLLRIVGAPPESLPRTSVHFGPDNKRPVLSTFFRLLYGSAFIISFGLIYLILDLLKFSLISKVVFAFFVSVVSFFAYRIRRVANQYLFEEGEGVFSPIVDFFMVPILRVGRVLSKGLAQINVLLFIVDILIEMPFKVVFELAEEWSAYIRGKRDEIV